MTTQPKQTLAERIARFTGHPDEPRDITEHNTKALHKLLHDSPELLKVEEALEEIAYTTEGLNGGHGNTRAYRAACEALATMRCEVMGKEIK